MRVAYLAPELPALSATFVYNEILQLEKLGTEVIPFSVNQPQARVEEDCVFDLTERTMVLYAEPVVRVLKSHLLLLAKSPLRYLKTLWLLCKDMWCVGLFTRTALGLGYRFLYSARLAALLLEKNCPHLHVHFAHIPADIAMYASSISGIPFSITAHANDIFERCWLLKQKVKRAHFFATISEFNKKYMQSIGVDTEHVKIIRCGVDPAKFSQQEEATTNTVVKIGVLARLVEKKGIDLLIKAVAQLKKKNSPVELYIAGNGPMNKRLINLCKEIGLTESDVHFLGAIAHSKVTDFLKSLDLFVLPCREDEKGDIDGIPVVLMEAMLAGVPVITSNLSGIPELVTDKKTGLLIEQNNLTALVGAIASLIEDDELRSRLIYNAAIKVKKDFSLIDNTKKLKTLFF
ncbi:MAG: colanic acid biosynthesis glycosyltransferase WcaL [Cycloclasticus sp.]|nr:colanic acid biosynthesis glycosyltransferase WcaL [Cycloclasticus sp.]MBG95270.1 colanic acid biosynthesis glycosyltransferase WcaL [Cycloclasticus sp.]HAI96476.1 colanic acid biosynthesis glycosyltransferase WcaL [Methylococcaceae bacterium]